MSDPIHLYNAWAIIDTAKLRHNIHQVKQLVANRSEILAIVKADAYGHGLEQMVHILYDEGIRWFGVANVREGLSIRRLFEEAKILILSSGMLPHAREIVRNRLIPVVSSIDMARALDREAESFSIVQNIHLKIDTGMGRIGIWHENIEDFAIKLKELRHVRLDGVCSHFSSSSLPDKTFAHIQLKRFKEAAAKLETAGFDIPHKHIGNSGAVINLDDIYFSIVRIGILFYGVIPTQSPPPGLDLKQIMTLKSKIAYIKTVEAGRPIGYMQTHITEKKTKIATVPIGYGDGYSRMLSNKAEALVRGVRCRVVGTVTMDQIMVDVGEVEDARIEDDVVLFGWQNDAFLPVTEVAKRAQTIPYDIMCSIKGRVCRVYT